MVWIIVSITLFAAGAICMYLFSLIAEDAIGKWFLVNGVACFVAALVLLYVVLW